MISGDRYEVTFHRLASNEYIRARRWYAKEGGEQLAERFRDEVDKVNSFLPGGDYSVP